MALAVDFDGTIALDGRVDDPTRAALESVRRTGRRLLLVTGRQLDDLRQAFDRLDLFDFVVAENGALLFEPARNEKTLLSPPIDERFVAELQRRGVRPLAVGEGIVSTWEPNEKAVLDAIRDIGLELQVIFNKGAVMVLPSGTNKASGLAQALQRLELSPRNLVGIGDAENDQAFLRACEFSAAVENAVPAVKEQVDFVTRGDHGLGVRQLIDALLEDDLSNLSRRLERHFLPIGQDTRGRPVTLPAYGENVLFAGASGSGKSTLAKGFVERLIERGYQLCIIDPEGDYEEFEEGVVLGDRHSVPKLDEILQILKDPTANLAVSLLGVPLADRPQFFSTILASLVEMRATSGRPHWLVLDEAHHILPAARGPESIAWPAQLRNVLFITVEPGTMMPEAVQAASTVCAVGEAAQDVLIEFARITGQKQPSLPKRKVPVGDALAWRRGAGVQRFTVPPTRLMHRRHRRKYAQGDVGPDQSFYFRGPKGRLNLRAQNLVLFTQLAEGVDDETWTYHLRRGDYTAWLRDVVKDEELAKTAEGLEKRQLPPKRSRDILIDAIGSRYTLSSTSSTDGSAGAK
ncbi:MAG TPA: HAD-IIB family hydrolase [Dehalococcoidia bacterium]|nr:HAD-IIB family hydrolase [Dehalococcoidia bacterium]